MTDNKEGSQNATEDSAPASLGCWSPPPSVGLPPPAAQLNVQLMPDLKISFRTFQQGALVYYVNKSDSESTLQRNSRQV